MANIKMTTEQQMVIDNVVDLLYVKGQQAVKILGCAGTGKTTTVFYILKKCFAMNINPGRICLTSFTNQACYVISTKTKRAGFNCSTKTLFSLCGANLNDPEERFKLDISRQQFKDFDLFILDECSMVCMKHYNIIKSVMMAYPKKKFIIIGDPAQLRPVENEKMQENPSQLTLALQIQMCNKSKIFDDYTIPTFELTERLRQGEGNPILDEADLYREISLLDNKPIENVEDKFITNEKGSVVSADWDDIKLDVFKKYKDIVDGNGKITDIKLVAYNQYIIDQYNTLIHRALFENSKFFEIGDIVVMNDGYETKDGILVTNGEQGQITNVKHIETNLEVLNPKTKEHEVIAKFPCIVNSYSIKFIMQGVVKNILVLNNDAESAKSYNNWIATIDSEKSKCMRNSKSWYYACSQYKNAKWGTFADLKYAYCVTAYKSQGSTYKEVIIHKRNIINNSRMGNQQKAECMYTAITRASDKVTLLE